MPTKNADDKSKSNPFAASTRIEAKTASTLSGQIRHDLRRGPQPAYVDAKRSHLNRVLIENAPIPKMRAICAERRNLRDTKRGIKSNAAIATAGIITFGSEAARMFETLSVRDQDRAFKLLTRLIARRLATSVHALCVHLDEATIHAHYQLAAVNRFGDPVSKSTSPKVMSELQDLTAKVMQKFCPSIERGYRYGDRLAAGADFADTIHKSVKELHQTLPADLEAKRASLAALSADEVAAQARVDEMQDRVTKLVEKAALSDQEVKRLHTYEKRLADRVNELQAMQIAAEAARAEADRLAGKALAKTAAFGAAVSSIAKEIESGTVRRTSANKISAARFDLLKPALPEIEPIVAAAADLVTDMKNARERLVEEQRTLLIDQRNLIDEQMYLMKAGSEIQSLRKKLKHALAMALSWLGRSELSDLIRRDGQELVEAAEPLLLPSENQGTDVGLGL